MRIHPAGGIFLTGAVVASAALAAKPAFAQTKTPPAAMTAADVPGWGGVAPDDARDRHLSRPSWRRDGDGSVHLGGDGFRKIKTVVSAPNGRPAEPLLEGDAFAAGRYEMLMHFDDYYAKLGVNLPDLPFLTKVFVRFAIVDNKQAYHVPVLFTPWSYSYYRGS